MPRRTTIAALLAVLVLVVPAGAQAQDADTSAAPDENLSTSDARPTDDVAETTDSPEKECACPTCQCPLPRQVAAAVLSARAHTTSAIQVGNTVSELREELEAEITADFQARGQPLTNRREQQNIDSLPEEGVSVEEALLFVPRVVLYPVHIVLEYGVRWPLGRLFTAIEKYRVVEHAVAALTFADGKAGFVPLLTVGGSQASAYGVNFFYHDLAGGHIDLEVGAQGFPGRNLTVKSEVEARVPNDRWRVGISGGLDRRDDYFFFGVGRQPNQRDAARFTMWETLMRLNFDAGTPDDPAGARLSLGFADRDIRCSTTLERDVCGVDETFSDDDLYDERIPGVAPLNRDHSVLRSELHLYSDSRSERPGSGTGVRLEGFAGGALGVGRADDLAAFRYGGEISGFWDVFGAHQRTVGLRLRAEAVEPVSESREIPVPELAALGGVEMMRGFREERFRGRSSLLATLDYRFPVWSFFDGEVFFEAGELAGPGFQNFEPGRLRGAAGIGLRSIDILGRHLSYDINVAVGTAPFSTGLAVDEFRVNLGTNWGF